ncbi:MAG: hypothetical protein FWC79_02730 [Oscillospiraceae bacterium]|nr:hypothetical protein [Oscillospiraceae bacterium]
MDLYEVGFSLIRMPNERYDRIYVYDSRINPFPEAVFVHEFLHTLERIMREHGYTVPDLHDYEEYGYSVQRIAGGARSWYSDYMTQSIFDENEGRNIGLYPIVYTLRPLHSSEFRSVREVSFATEPQNIFQDLRNMANRAMNVFRNAGNELEPVVL